MPAGKMSSRKIRLCLNSAALLAGLALPAAAEPMHMTGQEIY